MNDHPIIKAVYVPECPEITGSPDEGIWSSATGYPLSNSKDKAGCPQEGGLVKFAWNQHGLYVAAKLEDSCVVAKNKRDEQFHYMFGDVFELFLKPRNDEYYWEMYATPRGNKTTLFFPAERSGVTLDRCLNDHDFHGLETAAIIHRSEHESGSSEQGWSAEMWIPASQLSHYGEPWGETSNWSILCGRYNYSNEALTDPELSMLPSLSKTNFHLTNEYASLYFSRS
ncbi:DOMON domain-containing protein [Pontiella sulfatireligans]|uniref:Carbohydrate-binding domain-containing protein n=1 Tax=Pontiella sulfatireligans TaxID=2750658 RepID=A0A6C2UGT2_9BACT|nr:hypothetical protein [Pontiella sulfatireligans]VGO19063.1 hypothetical protein SCARR_01119 [Pontiella sulfatireligans]